MIENFIKAVMDFFKSPEFTAVVSSVSIVWITVAWPFLKKVLSAKTQIKLESAIAKAKSLTQDYKKLETKYLEVCAYVPKINELLMAQAETLKIAFNNSNLKADVKDLIDKKLLDIKPIEIPKLELVDEEENPILPENTDTALSREDENKKEANPSTEIIL